MGRRMGVSSRFETGPGGGDGAFAGSQFVAEWSTFPFIRATIVRALSKDRYNRR